MASPTSRTLQHLRGLGYTAAIVEKFNSFVKIRQDLFGYIDVLGIRSDRNGCLGIQTTSADHHSNRVLKAKANPILKTWLEAGNSFAVWSWGKKGARGKRKLWELRIEEIQIKDLTNTINLI